MSKEMADQNLKNLGKELGVDSLEFDADHQCVIEFEDGIPSQGQSNKIDIVIKEDLRQTQAQV